MYDHVPVAVDIRSEFRCYVGIEQDPESFLIVDRLFPNFRVGHQSFHGFLDFFNEGRNRDFCGPVWPWGNQDPNIIGKEILMLQRRNTIQYIIMVDDEDDWFVLIRKISRYVAIELLVVEGMVLLHSSCAPRRASYVCALGFHEARCWMRSRFESSEWRDLRGCIDEHI